MTDPIADMITRIKNAYLARLEAVEIPYSKIKAALAQIVVEEKYADSFEIVGDEVKKNLKLVLRYVNKIPAVSDVKRVSKPGRRVYSSVETLPRSLGGHGIVILSTNKGVMTEKKARQLNVGGEILCQIW